MSCWSWSIYGLFRLQLGQEKVAVRNERGNCRKLGFWGVRVWDEDESTVVGIVWCVLGFLSRCYGSLIHV